MKPARAGKTKPVDAGSPPSSGFPSPAEDYEEAPLDLHGVVIKNPAATFFMRADTDVMSHNGVQKGDILTVDRSLVPSAGNLLVAVIEGSLQVKRCVMTEHRLVVADDFGSMDIQPATTWGVVTYITRKV